MDLIPGGDSQSWYGGWAVAFVFGGTQNLEVSPDSGSTWFPALDGAGNDVTAIAGGTSVMVVLCKNVLVRATGTGTKMTLVRGYANTRSAGG